MEHELEIDWNYYSSLVSAVREFEAAEAGLRRVETKLVADKRYYGGDLKHRHAHAREVIGQGRALVKAIKKLLEKV